MDIEPLHPHEDLLENQNRSKPKHGHPDDSLDNAKRDNPDFLQLAKLFGESCAQSGLQDPLNSLVQFENNSAPSAYALPQVEWIAELPDTKVGSKAWFAETLGSGVGSIVPFLAIELATKRLGATSPMLAMRGAADSMPVVRSFFGLEEHSEYFSHMAKTGMDGAIYGGVLIPVSDPNKDFWQQRAKDTLSVSVTFGSQYGISHGLLNAIEKSGLGHMHFHEEKVLTAKSAAFHIGTNLIGGSTAGLIGTESMSYLYGQGPANSDSIKNAVASFAVTGLSLDAAHLAELKVVAHKVVAHKEDAQKEDDTTGHGQAAGSGHERGDGHGHDHGAIHDSNDNNTAESHDSKDDATHGPEPVQDHKPEGDATQDFTPDELTQSDIAAALNQSRASTEDIATEMSRIKLINYASTAPESAKPSE